MTNPEKSDGNSSNLKPGGMILYVVIFIAGLLVGGFASQQLETAAVEWEYPGGNRLSIDLKKDLSNFQALLDKIFRQDFSRHGALGWLKEKQSVFAVTDRSLVTELQNTCPNRTKESTEKKQQRLDECFDKHIVISDLRSLALNRQPPFQYTGNRVRVGLQSEEPHAPKDNYANACASGEFIGHEIRLRNPANKKYIDVYAGNPYVCVEDEPDIQLNRNDARKLFGKKQLEGEEAAIAYILN